MSELPSRDESSGQFVPSTEGLYGREAELVSAGFTLKKDDPPAEAKTYDDTLEGVEQAGRDLAARRAGAPAEISMDVVKETLDLRPITEARTAEQAARELSAMRADVGRYVEGLNLSKIGEEVDAARAQALKNNPTAKDDLGLSDQDVEAAKKADGESKEAEPAKQTRTRPDPIDGEPVQGLDPEVAKALEHPQVRAAIQEELTKAETAQQGYSQAIQTANALAQQVLIDQIGELGQIPIDQWETALTLLHQSGDPRVARALGAIERVSQLSTAQAQWSQHQAIERYQQFEASVASEDARLEQMLGKEAASEANAALVSYLGERGVERNQMLAVIHANPVLSTAEGRAAVWKAAEYDRMQQAAKTVRAQPLPKVQRPGMGTDRAFAAEMDARAMASKISGSKGDNAARLAAKAIMQRRNAR